MKGNLDRDQENERKGTGVCLSLVWRPGCFITTSEDRMSHRRPGIAWRRALQSRSTKSTLASNGSPSPTADTESAMAQGPRTQQADGQIDCTQVTMEKSVLRSASWSWLSLNFFPAALVHILGSTRD